VGCFWWHCSVINCGCCDCRWRWCMAAKASSCCTQLHHLSTWGAQGPVWVSSLHRQSARVARYSGLCLGWAYCRNLWFTHCYRDLCLQEQQSGRSSACPCCAQSLHLVSSLQKQHIQANKAEEWRRRRKRSSYTVHARLRCNERLAIERLQKKN
jgi:hypothetical protein